MSLEATAGWIHKDDWTAVANNDDREKLRKLIFEGVVGVVEHCGEGRLNELNNVEDMLKLSKVALKLVKEEVA